MSEIKPGDRVTPENVGALPDGAIVEWTFGGQTFTAERIEADMWYSPGNGVLFDHEIADPNDSPVTLVSLGIVDEGVPS